MSNRIRLLTASDVPQACALSRAVSWNQTEAVWGLAIEINTAGCLGVDVAARGVATTTTIRYGTRLAWVGMVLTHPEFRRQGLASALMERALDHLSDVETVNLDATEMGTPVYRRLGFVDDCVIERWIRPPGAVLPSRVNEYCADPSLDLEAFGADRSALLRRLANIEAASTGDAFAMGRGVRFGPCVSRSEESAIALLHCFVARHEGEQVLWDTFPSELPRRHGFELSRRLTRMIKGPALHANDSLIYAGAGFEFG
jgi:GNAT superfamily N-acetyltransferase